MLYGSWVNRAGHVNCSRHWRISSRSFPRGTFASVWPLAGQLPALHVYWNFSAPMSPDGRNPPGRPPHPSATANLLGVAAHRAIVLDGWQHLNAREPRDASSQAMSLGAEVLPARSALERMRMAPVTSIQRLGAGSRCSARPAE